MIIADTKITHFPPFSGYNKQPTCKSDLRLDSPDHGLDSTMAHPGSPAPYIKEDPDQFNPNFHGDFDMSQHFSNSQQQYGVNPNDLTMGNNFIMNNQYGSNNMSSSFLGNSNIGDDELRDLVEEPSNNNSNPNGGFQNFSEGHNEQQHQQGYFHGQMNNGSMAVSTQNMNNMYSNTPDGAPIQSPFVNNGFNYDQFQNMQQAHRVGSMPNGSFSMGARQHSRMGLDRQMSDSRSPMTPKTPAMAGLHLSTPDSGSFPASQPIHAGRPGHGHQKSMSGQWDNTPGSGGSWIDSPIVSPQQGGMHHAQIADVLSSGKHASLPTKVEGQQGPGFQTQEAKRRRRRESHNMVERRRRDNINERIQDLSKLVPQHRLEDEKVRKHIHNNGPLSPTMSATGISPPQATSLLAGPNGRRAAGNITTGLPLDEKDKGPNKGDILNGSVSWTRDLMWMLYLKLKQEEQLFDQIRSLGGEVNYEYSEEETRMRTELIDAVEKNNWETFRYSRGPGSGLRVPKHTNIAGDPLQNPMSPQSLSPAIQSGGSGANSGAGQPGFWANQQPTFKEEEEFGMEL
ncbi:hlh transcription factor (gamma) [Neofusicoccum parvum]|uniref:Hlh transcription factor (Gamma) n=3 Tax=Neofusicoccum TaxID=407951 RepID=A0ACB5RR79_9PEZI|nr:putative hlh transcription factor (gamma) protein [Neofusicoccum parvum UCRNP2]GME23032.1 hlh transcription factor (gamma) [Neofusicoccum parvum]GME50861.1 hlh transcription factor (gamma) [Neofusicoccum parvum]